MNIYELEKKATPGPYFYAKYLPGIQTTGVMEDTGLDDDSGNPIRAPLTVVNTTGACGGDNPCEDMALLAHCRNHFMKALEALKSEVGLHKEQGRIGKADQLRELIARLEEVEGV